jgi:hypothetical protein
VEKPRVLVISETPLLREAISLTLDAAARVEGFSGGRGDPNALLRWSHADVVIVESGEVARELEEAARQSNLLLIELALEEDKLRVLRHGGWEESQFPADAPEAMRSILLGEVMAHAGGGEESADGDLVAPPGETAGDLGRGHEVGREEGRALT